MTLETKRPRGRPRQAAPGIKSQGALACRAKRWADNLDALRAEWGEIKKLDEEIEFARFLQDWEREDAAWARLREVLTSYAARGADWGDNPDDYEVSVARRAAGAKGGAAGKGQPKRRRTREERRTS